jgi:hypothetical protein
MRRKGGSGRASGPGSGVSTGPGVLGSGALAAVSARLAYTALTARPPGGSKTWTRANHRGEQVTLLSGPAVTVGAIAGAAANGGLSRRVRLAMVVAGSGAAAFGGYDDLAGDGSSRGFRGHFGALARGELTTGAVKLAGIGATGLAAALLATDGADHAGRADRGIDAEAVADCVINSGLVADCVINAGLVAGGANLINLFDLRPGRAAKVALVVGGLLSAAPGSAGPRAAAPVGAAAALLPEDLTERTMLGDAGANALGAMLGVAATALPRRGRLAALGVIVGLTAASEAVSFTRVIERTPALRWLDMLGRRPVAVADSRPAEQAADECPGEPMCGPDMPASQRADAPGYPAGSR